MNDKKQETRPDILAEMREQANEPTIESLGEVISPIDPDDVKNWADRLEAAERERIEVSTVAATQAVNLTNEKRERDAAPGNIAALRDALETVLKNHDHMILPEICCPNCGEDFQLHGNLPPDITRKLKAALEESPRNCDVGTPKEQRVRFITWCENHNLECEDCPLRAFRDSGDCGFAWMQMPYEGKEKPNE